MVYTKDLKSFASRIAGSSPALGTIKFSMNKADILSLIAKDNQMMEVINIAKAQNLPDWYIGAGFARNKIWNVLHNLDNEITDIDLVYFAPNNTRQKDEEISKQLKLQTGSEWQAKNQFYMHEYSNLQPFKNTSDAISFWPETATAIGIKIKENGKLDLVAPFGVEDLVNLVLRPNKKLRNYKQVFEQRIKSKNWLQRWSKLTVVS